MNDQTHAGADPAGETVTGVERTRLIAATVPPAVAIVVFGAIYGSLAEPLMGWRATLLSSLLIFSGAVQFAIVALLSAGAGGGAISSSIG